MEEKDHDGDSGATNAGLCMMATELTVGDEVIFVGVPVGHLANMMEALTPGDDPATQLRIRLCHAVVFGVSSDSPWIDVQVGGGMPLAAFSRPFTGFLVLNEMNYTVGLLPAQLDPNSTLRAGEAKDVFLPFKAIKAHINPNSGAHCEMRFGGDGVCHMCVKNDVIEIPLMVADVDIVNPGGRCNVFSVINQLFGRSIDVAVEVATQNFSEKLKRISHTTVWFGVHAAQRLDGEKVGMVTLAEAKASEGDAVAAFGTVLALAERLGERENIAALQRVQLTGAGPLDAPAAKAAAEATMGVAAANEGVAAAAVGGARVAALANKAYFDAEDDEDGSGAAGAYREEEHEAVGGVHARPTPKRAKIAMPMKAAGALVKYLAPLALATRQAQARNALAAHASDEDRMSRRAFDVPCVIGAGDCAGLANRYALYCSTSLDMQKMMSIIQIANRVSSTMGIIATSNAMVTGTAIVVPFKDSEGCIMWVQTGSHVPNKAGRDDDYDM